MAGLMRGNLVTVSSSDAVAPETIVSNGVRQKPDVDALATRSDHKLDVMVWNYQDEDVAGPTADIDLKVSGLPSNAKHVLLRHYLIDTNHSNAYTVWQQMGSPQHPSAAQYSKLEKAGQLQLLGSPHSIDESAGSATLKLALPLQSVSLVELSW
jgi:xylan 1,4-beta-xylosidase